MNLVPVQPSAGFVTLAEVKDHLRIDEGITDHDTVLTLLIASACGLIEGRDGFTGLAIARQQWDARYHAREIASCNGLHLPLPPLISVDTITYRDAAGSTQTFLASNYEVRGIGSILDGCIALKSGIYMPYVHGADALTVRFTAGFVSDAGNPAVPATIKAAALLVIATMFDNRESASDPLAGAPTALLSQFRR